MLQSIFNYKKNGYILIQTPYPTWKVVLCGRMSYLGVSIGANLRRKVFWEPLIKKFKGKLARWKSKSLNLAGRMILTKASLNSLFGNLRLRNLKATWLDRKANL